MILSLLRIQDLLPRPTRPRAINLLPVALLNRLIALSVHRNFLQSRWRQCRGIILTIFGRWTWQQSATAIVTVGTCVCAHVREPLSIQFYLAIHVGRVKYLSHLNCARLFAFDSRTNSQRPFYARSRSAARWTRNTRMVHNCSSNNEDIG